MVYVVVTFLFGEVIAPVTSEMADRLRAEKLGISSSQEFRSGQWTKDLIRSNGLDGDVIGSRFLNVRDIRRGELKGIKVYEFDRDFHLAKMITAERAEYRGSNVWRLIDVTETRFDNSVLDENVSRQDIGSAISTTVVPTEDMVSEITPQILQVSSTDPDNMTAYRLATYIEHLAENNQNTALYDIAFLEEDRQPVYQPGDDCVGIAVRLFAYPCRRYQPEGIYRHHDRRQLHPDQSPVFLHGIAQYVAAILHRGIAECAVFPGCGVRLCAMGREALTWPTVP